jgi:hypothetical protein
MFIIVNDIETESRPAVKFRVKLVSRANEKKAVKSLSQIQTFSLVNFTSVRLGVMFNCSHNHGLIWDTTVIPHSLCQVSTLSL